MSNELTATEERLLDRTADVIAGAVNASVSRPSKPDAAKLAGTVIDAWIKRRSIALHRDARTYLIEDLAEAFGVPEVKEAQGVS